MPRTTTSADASGEATSVDGLPSVDVSAPSAAAPAKPARARKAVAKEPAQPVEPIEDVPPLGAPASYAGDQELIERQRALLIEERATYMEQAQSLRAEAESLVEEMEPGDIQFDEESGEGGTVTVDRERDLALSAQALAAVEEIDDALRKIERGTYGICESCGEAIPSARLEALPYARLCVACKSGGLSRR
ncbi:MAG: TraR/DksA family transcriptional regulator [Acidimicrobiales bacterium]